MALYIPHSIFHLARLLNVRPETFWTLLRSCKLFRRMFAVLQCCIFHLEIQGPAEIPEDLATQMRVKPLAWGICPSVPFKRDSKHFICHGALVGRATGFRCVDVFQKQRFCRCTRRIFRRHCNIHRNDTVPSRNTVMLWVGNF